MKWNKISLVLKLELLFFIAFFLIFTAVNFIRLLRLGILVKITGSSGSYRSNVLELFYSGQETVLWLSLLIALVTTGLYFMAPDDANQSR